MLGNIVDKRSDRFSPDVDAVFEPSAHDNAVREDGSYVFDPSQAERDPSYFYVVATYDTTIRDAIMKAKRSGPFP